MLSNDGYAEREWTLMKVMLSLLVIIGILSLIKIETMQPNEGNDPANDYLNAVQFYARMQGGEQHAFEVPASANLHGVHEAVKAAVGHAVTLTFHGEPLLNDKSVSIADVGIGPECVIDASPNDLQILGRANNHLWTYLIKWCLEFRRYPPLSPEIESTLRGIDSYQSLEIAARDSEMNVFEFTRKYLSGLIRMDEETDKIHAFYGCLGKQIHFFDLGVLSQLTDLEYLQLYIEVNSPETRLEELSRMKGLGSAVLNFHCNGDLPSEARIVIPDMTECKGLYQLEIRSYCTQSRLIIDCKESKLNPGMVVYAQDKDAIEWPMAEPKSDGDSTSSSAIL